MHVAHPSRRAQVRAPQDEVKSIIKHRRRHKTAEFALDQFGQFQRRAIFQPRADDLDPDRQSFRRTADRYRGGGQAGQGGDAGVALLKLHGDFAKALLPVCSTYCVSLVVAG